MKFLSSKDFKWVHCLPLTGRCIEMGMSGSLKGNTMREINDGRAISIASSSPSPPSPSPFTNFSPPPPPPPPLLPLSILMGGEEI